MKYRIPDISEFIEGFEYEEKIRCKGDKLGSVIIWDLVSDPDVKSVLYCEDDRWSKKVHPIKYEDNEVVVKDYGDYTFTSSGKYENVLNDTDIDRLSILLKEGKIRVMDNI